MMIRGMGRSLVGNDVLLLGVWRYGPLSDTLAVMVKAI